MVNNEPTLRVLSNGIRALHLARSAPVSHIAFFLRAGSRFESQNEKGLAHFLEHCLFKGTKTKKSLQILSSLDAVGGELNAYTAKEEMCIHASFASKYTKRAVDLISDLLLCSTFPEKEIEKEKNVILDEINAYLDNPFERIFDEFEERLFPSHALGANILGDEESVASFNRDDLIRYLNNNLNPEEMVVAYAGDMEDEKFFLMLEKELHSIPPSVSLGNKKFIPVTEYKFFSVQTEESNYQSHALIGGRAPSYRSEDRMPMSILMNYLGGPALNARLALTIREKYGYSYNIEAGYNPFFDTGYWYIYFGADVQNVQKCILLIHKELENLCNKALSPARLTNIKRQLKGQLALGMDSNNGLMMSYAKGLLLLGKIETFDETCVAIDKVTTDDLNRVSQTYLATALRSMLVFNPST
jgi:predicted Zn-dependent peptidase